MRLIYKLCNSHAKDIRKKQNELAIIDKDNELKTLSAIALLILQEKVFYSFVWNQILDQ